MKNVVAICLSLFCASANVVSASSASPSPATTRPVNILWLTVEDMSPWLACYGDATAPTPNIDRLARQGVRYTRAYSTTPVCAPARHTLITGMYATQTGAMHMRTGQPSREALKRDPHAYDEVPSYEAVPPPQVRCFPEYLRSASYYATNNVKQDYQFVAPPTVWDDSSRTAHYRNRRAGQPFFAVFNCTFTHEGQAFADAPIRSNAVKPADVKLPPYYPDTPAIRATLAQTYNNIVAMDEWLGRKLEELEREKLLDSTIVFFFSDQGVGLPRGKRSSYDSGLRVPLIVRFPDGRGAGTSDDRLISFLDFAPTMLSLAALKPPDHLRGRPFLGKFQADPPSHVFSTLDRVDEVMDTVRSVSDGRYRYIRNLMPATPHLPSIAYRERNPMMPDLRAMRAPGVATPQQWQMISQRKPPEEFYDCQTDPHEVKDLIDSPEHVEQIKAMRVALDRWSEETGDLGLIQPEARMVREKLWPPDGRQPSTAAPAATLKAGLLTIECATEGASIGYRQRGEASWRVYLSPVRVDDAQTYEVVAHRIGFKRSAAVEVPAARPKE